jgi:molybdate transport system substrate-binding protein
MKVRLLFILFVIIFGGCRTGSPESAGNSPKDALTISAAVSLKDAFNEIGGLYKTKTGRAVNFNFGASGALQRQIENGAPVDVFASAGTPQMDELAGKNLIATETRRDFARNTLVLIVPGGSKLNLTAFSDLVKPDVQKIAVGNPKTVPAGGYSEQVFDKIDLKTGLRSKLIFAEDVRQVLDYVARGEVDAGLVYGTDARSAEAKVRVAAVAPEDSHAPILYPLAVLKDSRQKGAAEEFIELVLGAEGQTILKKYGFATVTEK